MKWETVLVKREGSIATVVMNRPESFNAFDFSLGDDLVGAFEVCMKDNDIRVVVLTGAGKAFNSGGDLKAAGEFIATDPSEPFRQLTKRLNRLITDIRRCSKPVIAAINGSVGGAGISIAAACDLRIASAKAKFRQAYTSAGLVPDGAWTLIVPLLIGFGRASELIFLDPVFDARKALELGLVNKVVEESEFENTVNQWALKLAAGPTRSFALAKELLNNALLTFLERQLELERQGIVAAAGSQDYLEGSEAFFAKRLPVFTGK